MSQEEDDLGALTTQSELAILGGDIPELLVLYEDMAHGRQLHVSVSCMKLDLDTAYTRLKRILTKR